MYTDFIIHLQFVVNQAKKYSLQLFDSLKNLNESKYEWKIKVRVLRKWESFGPSKGLGGREFKAINLLLMDKEVQKAFYIFYITIAFLYLTKMPYIVVFIHKMMVSIICIAGHTNACWNLE